MSPAEAHPRAQQPFNYAGGPQQDSRGQQAPGQDWAAPAASAAPSRPSIWAAFGPGRNTFGVVSLLAVAVALLLSTILQIVTALVIVGNGFTFVGLLNGVSAILSIVLTLIALVFGILGLLSSNPSKWPAIAGTSIGAFVFVSTLVGFATSALYTVF